jgi:alanyl-tRNA synthetase
VRKSTRVTFVCGLRALRRAHRDFQALTEIAGAMSSAIDDAPAAIAAQLDRLKEAETARKRIDRELATLRARERYDAAEPDENGVRTIVVRDAGSMDELRTLAQATLSLPRVIVLGSLATPPSVLVAASEDSGVDAGKVLKERLSRLGGRGGGSPRIAQGSVPDPATAESLVSELLSART